MRTILHILTRTDDALATEIIALHRENSETKIEVFDLTAGEPEYPSLLEKIFEADSVQVWGEIFSGAIPPFAPKP